jgi:hypothetical protein
MRRALAQKSTEAGMVTRDSSNAAISQVELQAPERLESRLTPMFMCCGHWTYTFTIGLNGPTVSVSWTEDGEAACNQI